MPYSESVYLDALARATTDLARDDVVSLRETLRQAKNVGNDFLDRLVEEILLSIKSRKVETKISVELVDDITGHS
jgi:hypothetical protein